MPVYDVELSASGIDTVIRSLSEFRQVLQQAEHQIVQALAEDAASDMTASLAAVTDPDGNVDVRVESQVVGTSATVSLTGEQAAFLEFGTGIVGQNSPHEMAGQFGWDYATGPRIRTFRNGRIGWVYFDRSRNHYRVTSGIAPQRIVLRGAQAARARVRDRVREALR